MFPDGYMDTGGVLALWVETHRVKQRCINVCGKEEEENGKHLEPLSVHEAYNSQLHPCMEKIRDRCC